MKINALVIARPNSTRLPQKHNRLIGEKTVLNHLIDNVKTCTLIDSIIVCTTNKSIDYIKKCTNDRTDIIISSLESEFDINVMGRIVNNAKLFKADYYFIISGDCPLINPSYLNEMFELLSKNKYYDYSGMISGNSHQGVELIRYESLINLGYDEHLAFNRHNLKGVFVSPLFADVKFRGTLDNFSDLFFLRECNRLLNNNFNYIDVEHLVKNNYELRMINKYICQKSPMERSKKIALITYGDDIYGLGHVSRTIGNAQVLNESHHQGIMIMVNDNESAINMLTELGYENNLDFIVYNNDSINKLSYNEYDIIYNDTPNKVWFNGLDYVLNPTMLVNRRIKYNPYGVDTKYESDVLVSFGKGKYIKYIPMVVDKLNLMDYNTIINNGQAPFIQLLHGCKKYYSMWSQSAREALYLEKDVYVFTYDKYDDYICECLHDQGVLTWLGNINTFLKENVDDCNN